MLGCEILQQVPKTTSGVPKLHVGNPRREGSFLGRETPISALTYPRPPAIPAVPARCKLGRLLNDTCLNGYSKCLTCFISSLQSKDIFIL